MLPIILFPLLHLAHVYPNGMQLLMQQAITSRQLQPTTSIAKRVLDPRLSGPPFPHPLPVKAVRNQSLIPIPVPDRSGSSSAPDKPKPMKLTIYVLVQRFVHPDSASSPRTRTTP